ncbi:phage head-tail joining protein [Albibacillus kandeliae]|uniref:phage head-tail joining protein n=1 Tax=Albibacillus kandeliae TaxID=2174228 RepID=UPI000D6989EA|nr:gpW family head-tail joining protein [Albibacillus kandeliae]
MATDTATLEAQLEEARGALHKLAIGGQLVKIKYEDGETEYSRASMPELRRYIRSLERQLGQTSSAPGSRKVIF